MAGDRGKGGKAKGGKAEGGRRREKWPEESRDKSELPRSPSIALPDRTGVFHEGANLKQKQDLCLV